MRAIRQKSAVGSHAISTATTTAVRLAKPGALPTPVKRAIGPAAVDFARRAIATGAKGVAVPTPAITEETVVFDKAVIAAAVASTSSSTSSTTSSSAPSFAVVDAARSTIESACADLEGKLGRTGYTKAKLEADVTALIATARAALATLAVTPTIDSACADAMHVELSCVLESTAALAARAETQAVTDNTPSAPIAAPVVELAPDAVVVDAAPVAIAVVEPLVPAALVAPVAAPEIVVDVVAPVIVAAAAPETVAVPDDLPAIVESTPVVVAEAPVAVVADAAPVAAEPVPAAPRTKSRGRKTTPVVVDVALTPVVDAVAPVVEQPVAPVEAVSSAKPAVGSRARKSVAAKKEEPVAPVVAAEPVEAVAAEEPAVAAASAAATRGRRGAAAKKEAEPVVEVRECVVVGERVLTQSRATGTQAITANKEIITLNTQYTPAAITFNSVIIIIIIIVIFDSSRNSRRHRAAALSLGLLVHLKEGRQLCHATFVDFRQLCLNSVDRTMCAAPAHVPDHVIRALSW
jgi:hypothetical protein